MYPITSLSRATKVSTSVQFVWAITDTGSRVFMISRPLTRAKIHQMDLTAIGTAVLITAIRPRRIDRNLDRR